MGIIITEQFKQKYSLINEVKITSKESGLPVDVEFASRPTGHARFKFKDSKTKSSKEKSYVSISMDNNEVKINNGKFDKSITKQDKEKIYRFVELEWDLLGDAYYRNEDQQVVKDKMLNRLKEHNKKCKEENRKEDMI